MSHTERAWTFDGYWNVVCGPACTAKDFVDHFDLAGAPDDQLEHALRAAEAEAWRQGGLEGEIPASWAGYRTRALEALQAAT